MKIHTLAMAIALSVNASATLADTSINSNKQDKNDIERVTVVSSRLAMPLREIATSVSVVTQQDIQDRGYINLADVLEVQPAINTTNSGGLGTVTALRIRGEEGFRTQIRVDGVEISDPTAPQIGPLVGQLQSTGAARVDILRGAQGFAYGADVGGVILVQSTAYEEPLQGSIRSEYGRFNTSNIAADIGGKHQKFDYLLSVSNLNTEGFNARVDDESADKDGYDNTTAHLRLGYQLNERLSFGLVGRLTDGEGEFDNCGFGATASNDCQNDIQQENLRVSANYSLTSGTHELAFSKNFIERDFLNQNVLEFFFEGTLERLEYLANTRLNDHSNVVYGFDWKQETSTSNDVSRNNRGYHVEYQITPISHTHLTLGLRLDDNDDFGNHTSYRFTAAHIIPINHGEVKLRAAFGTGFRAPSLSELAFNRGPFAFSPATEAQLNEETSQGYEAAVQYTNKQGIELELVYFDQEVEDLLFFDLVNFSGFLQEEGVSESKGIEVIGGWQLNDSLSFSANFTYNDATLVDDSQRLRRPRRLANLGVNYAAEKLRFNANIRYVGDALDIGNTTLDDYYIVDISARYAINQNFDVYARVENLFDEDYQDLIDFNTPGAAPHIGVSYRF